MKRVMALILVIKDMLQKRIGRALLWQQLSPTIDVEMFQNVMLQYSRCWKLNLFNKEIKHLMSRKVMLIAVLVNWIHFSIVKISHVLVED